MTLSRTRLGTTGLLAAGVAVLALTTGCGVSGASIHPGVAAEVGSTSVPMDTVDTASRAYCDFIAGQAQGAVAGSTARTTILKGYVLRAIADDMNTSEHLDATPSPSYAQQYGDVLDQLQVSTLSPAQVSDVIVPLTGFNYFVDLVGQFGARSRGAAGATASPNDQVNAGIKLVQAYLTAHPLYTDPSFPRIAIGDTGVDLTATSLSVPLSDFAQTVPDATAPTPSADPAYLASLPSSQVCG